MNKALIICIAGASSLFSAIASGAPGEYWEVTTKMEVPGVPYAMPPMTNRVCIGKGEANDPRRSLKEDDCEMSDVKTSGDKTTWTARCTHGGDVMIGRGEQTTAADSYQGTMHFSGKSMNMTQSYSGKRVGGACDT